VCLQRGFFGGICRSIIHGLPNFQHGRRLYDFLHASRIVDARQFHQNLVSAQAVFLDRWFRDSQLIDTVADGFDRLRHRGLLHCRKLRRLHLNRPVAIRLRCSVVLRELVPENGAHVTRRVRGNSFEADHLGMILRVGYRNIRVLNVRRAQRILQPLDHLLRIRLHRIIDLHLQDEVSAASKVESKMDILLDARQNATLFHGLNAGRRIGAKENSPHEDQQGADDQQYFVSQILLHGAKNRLRLFVRLFLFFVVRDYRNNRTPRHFQLQVIRRNPQYQRIVFDRNNCPTQPAAGHHFVPRLQLLQHRLPLFLPALLRTNHQQVQDPDHQDDGQEQSPAGRRRRLLNECEC
jgi:hypothetical protein